MADPYTPEGTVERVGNVATGMRRRGWQGRSRLALVAVFLVLVIVLTVKLMSVL